MARVLYGSNISDLRGKINGHVFTRTKGGAAIRNKVTPINPRTTYQSIQRANTSNIAKAWANTLTNTQRTGWTAYGKLLGAKNVFGNGIILSGIATYQRINKYILAAGAARVDTAPVSNNVTALTSLAITANHTGGVLTAAFGPTPLVAPEGLYLFATPAISPGITNANSLMRLLAFYSAAATGQSFATAWVARFGAVPAAAGPRITVKAFVLNSTTGAISAPFLATTLVT